MTKLATLQAWRIVDALRTVGNLRLPYMIASKDIVGGESLNWLPSFVRLTDYLDSYDDLAAVMALLAKQSTIVLADNAPDWLIAMSNETDEPFDGFRQVEDSRYIRIGINCIDYAAYDASKLLQGFEPYHTAIVHKATGDCAVILWDTREVIATCNVKPDKLGRARHINDCGRLLMNMQGLVLPETLQPIILYNNEQDN